jgi:hypothetical protein
MGKLTDNVLCNIFGGLQGVFSDDKSPGKLGNISGCARAFQNGHGSAYMMLGWSTSIGADGTGDKQVFYILR